MSERESFKEFFSEGKQLVREWMETRLEIYKLKIIKAVSRVAGSFFWIMISLFLALLFVIFGGVTMGYWLSELTGSYVKGFGLVTAIILVLIILLAIFRKVLFINPIIRLLINKMVDENPSKKEED